MSQHGRIELLGGLRLVRGETTIERFRTRKTGLLLGYLAHGLGQWHSREVLIGMLWPNSDSESARTSLSTCL